MGKSTYIVPIVKRDLMSLWPTIGMKEAQQGGQKVSRDGSLGKTLSDGEEQRDAVAIAEAQNPGHVAIQDVFRRLADAHGREAPR